MATIRAYTDEQQSKKLAEILPIESADMRYVPFGDIHPWVWNEEVKLLEKGSVPCWSLASLLGVLPKKIELEGVAYELSIYLNGLYYWNVNNGNLLLEVKGKDNLVDACVDMIIKLNKLNLL